MRAFSNLIVILALFVICLVIVGSPNAMLFRGYFLFQIFFLAIALFGWSIAYYHRGNGSLGFVRYVAGIIVITLGLIMMLGLASSEAGNQKIRSTLPFMTFLVPPIWGIWSLFKWQRVKEEYFTGIASLRNQSYTDQRSSSDVKSKRDEIAANKPVKITGQGKQVSDAINLSSGRYRLKYKFSNNAFSECEITYQDVNDLDASSKSIVKTRSRQGEEMIVVPETSQFVFVGNAYDISDKPVRWDIELQRI